MRTRAAVDFLLAHWTTALALGPDEYATHGEKPLAVDTLHEWRRTDTGLLRTTRDGASRACALLDLDRRAQVLAGRGPDRDTRYPDAYCPECGHLGTIVRRTPALPGSAAPLRCTACYRHVPEDTWDAWAALDEVVVEHQANPMAGTLAAVINAGRAA